MPCETSLIPDWESDEVYDKVREWSKFKWIRASELADLNDAAEGKLEIFKDTVEPGDIVQGALGDCYFLSTLSVLAEE